MDLVDVNGNNEGLGPASRMNNCGAALHSHGQVQEALLCYQQAVQLQMKVLKSVTEAKDSTTPSDTEQLTFDKIFTEINDVEFFETRSPSNSIGSTVRSLPLFQALCDGGPIAFSEPICTNTSDSDFEQSEIILYNLALAHFELSNYVKAEELCRLALDMFPGHLVAAKTLNCLAQIKICLSVPHEAMEYLTEALHLEKEYFQLLKSESMASIDLDSCVASTLSLMGRIQFLHGYPDHAEEVCREALRIHESNYGRNSIQVAVAEFNLGLVYKTQGKFVDSLDRIARFIQRISEELLSHPQWLPQVAMAHSIAGTIQLEMGDCGGAIKHLSQAVDLRRYAHPPNHVHIAETLTSLGRAHFLHGHLDDAMTCFKEASRIPMQPEHVATVHCHIGHVYYANGDLSKALEAYKIALDRATSALEITTDNIVNLLVIIGRILLQQGNVDEAMTYYAEARRVQRGIPQESLEENLQGATSQDAFSDLFSGNSFHPAPAA